jgi:MFS family permease
MTQNASPSQVPYPAPSVGWYATVCLALLYWLSILDRFIISLMVDPIKKDMGLSDVQFGLLHGMAFAITYSLFGLIAGALADRYSRRWIIFFSVSVWSMATAACGMAVHYWQLLLARVGVGVGEAGLNPSATSMLTDLFPRDRLTTAMAVYSIGATIGSGTAYLFGGMIVDMVSQAPTYALPLIGEVRSWQAVFFIIGVPGVLLSLIVFTFPEPVRRDRKPETREYSFWEGIVQTYKNLLAFIATQKKFFAHHYAGFALASIVMGGCGVWYPAHMGRTFGWSASQIGLYLGLTLIVSSISGKLLCGYAADALYRRGYRDAQFRWYGWSLMLAVPFGILAMQFTNPYYFLACVSIFLILLAPLPACYIAALNLVTPNQLRGAGVAFFSGTAGLIGMATGPLIIAFFSDHVFGGNAIGLGMAATIAICCPAASILLLSGCKAMHQAVVSLESSTQ